MKIRFKPTVVLMAAVAVIAGIVIAQAAKQKSIPAFNPEQTQGEVRVVLLRLERHTIYTDPHDPWRNRVMAEDHKRLSALPFFKVTFWLEVPREGAFGQVSMSTQDQLDILVDGKSILDGSGTSGGTMGFEDLPHHNELRQMSAPEGRAGICAECYSEGESIPTGPVDIRFKIKWKGVDKVFLFKNVPVN
jgi:hypothetical protein